MDYEQVMIFTGIAGSLEQIRLIMEDMNDNLGQLIDQMQQIKQEYTGKEGP